MRNLNEFVRKSGAALGGATGQAPPQAPQRGGHQPGLRGGARPDLPRLRRRGRRHHPPRGRQDRVRRAGGEPRGLGGIQSGAIEFEVEFSDVNGDQQIEAPANARPLSSLTQLARRDGVPRRRSRARGAADHGAREPERPAGPGARPGAEDFQALHRLPRQGAPGGHRGAPALRRAARTALDARRSGLAQVALGVDAPARGQLGVLRPERPAVGPLLALVVGRGALEQHRAGLSPIARISTTSSPVSTGSAGTAASSSRLRSIGLASGPAPGSASAPRTPPRRGRGSRRRPAGAASARGARRSAGSARAARARPRPSPSGRKPRWSWASKPWPGSTSSWNSPP